MKINRVLIVGLGSIGTRHLRLARMLLPEADIRVLRHKKSIDIPEYSNGCLSTLEEAIAFAPEIAVIASPASFHIPVAYALANVGTNLLVEKPLSSNIDGVEQLIECCKSKNVILLIGYNLRYLLSLKKYRELLHSNTIGQIFSVRCEIGQYLPTWRPGSDYRQSVSANRSMGGGALLELSHELDYLGWIFGEVDWVKATLAQQSKLDIDVEDTAHLTLGFKSTESNKNLIATLNLDLIRHDTTRQCTAIGELGSLCWNGLTGSVSIYKAGSNQWDEICRYPHQRDDSYLNEWKHMLACIERHETPLINGDDGFQVLRVIEAARRSSDTGNKIQLASITKSTQTNV